MRGGEEPVPHLRVSLRPWWGMTAPSPAACMVARTPRSARHAPTHPVPAASSAGVRDSHPSRRAGRPRRAEGMESVPRQRTRGHQLLPALKGRGAAWGTQHARAGERRGTSPHQDNAVTAAVVQPRTAEPEKGSGGRFSCAATAEDRQAGAARLNRCFLQLFAGVKQVLAPPMSANRSSSSWTLQADILA